MQRKLIYFINPISGTKNKNALLKLIKIKTEDQNLLFEILPTKKNGDYYFLPEKIRAENITDIIICGGDGTINQVAAYVLNTGVNIGIVPMGSGNGLAFAAGIPKNTSRAIDIILKGRPITIDCFYINDKFSCMLCGLGFDAQVAHDFAEQSSRGIATYVKQTFKNFFSATPFPFIIEINNTRICTDAFFISIANSNQFGNNVTIAPQASLSDGLLDIVIVNKMGKLKMLFSVLKQIRFGKVQHISEKEPATAIQYFQTKKLVIYNPSFAPLHIDGDPAETSKRFDINIVQKGLSLICP